MVTKIMDNLEAKVSSGTTSVLHDPTSGHLFLVLITLAPFIAMCSKTWATYLSKLHDQSHNEPNYPRIDALIHTCVCDLPRYLYTILSSPELLNTYYHPSISPKVSNYYPPPAPPKKQSIYEHEKCTIPKIQSRSNTPYLST